MNDLLQEVNKYYWSALRLRETDWFVALQISLTQSGRVNVKWKMWRGGGMICDNNATTGPSPSDVSTID